MIPVQLTLSGFLSYQEPNTLSFEDFDLACISGQNGAGKSSILEAITWALFGRARGQSDDSIINTQHESKEARVEFTFSYENDLYRVIRSKVAGKTAQLEFQVFAPEKGWLPLTEKSIRFTERRIETTLHLDYDTFINASFFLQGKADEFAQRNPGERKRILGSILGLDIWEGYREAAAERRRGVELELRDLAVRMAAIDEELAEEPQRVAAHAQAVTRLKELEEARSLRDRQLELARRVEESLEDKRRTVRLLQRTKDETGQRCQTLRGQVAENARKLLEIEQISARQAEIERRHQAWLAVRERLGGLDQLAQRYATLREQRSGPEGTISAEYARLQEALRGVEDRLAEITRRQPLLEEIRNRIPTQDQALTNLRAEAAVIRTGEETANLQKEEAAVLEAVNVRIYADTHEMRERIDQLQSVTEAVCPLCNQPLAEPDRLRLIAQLEDEGKQKKSEFIQNREQIEKLLAAVTAQGTAMNGLAEMERRERELVRQISQLESQLAEMEAEQTRSAGLRTTHNQLKGELAGEQFAAEARVELNKLDAAIRDLGYDAQVHSSARQEELASRKVETEMRDLSAALATMASLAAQQESLANLLAAEEATLVTQTQEWETAQRELEQQEASSPDADLLEREALQARAEENRWRSDVGSLRQLVDILDVRRRERKETEHIVESVTRRLGQLRFLERAFGRDGIQALLIEEAVPEIEMQANELLDQLTAGQMSVRFDTQRQLKSRDSQRETLDINITDGAGSRAYEMYSGGEAFRVNFAVRLALAKVLANRAGARLQTLFIDEGFGSQDANGRQRLLEVLNLVRPMFAKILVITHMEELKDAFPARVEVEKTAKGSQIRVVT